MNFKLILTPLLFLFAVTAVDALCNYGAVGVCGRFVPFMCPQNSTCRHLIPGAPIGLCCLDMADPRCPPPSMVGICPFGMLSVVNGNCMNNNDCTNNQVCCPDACGGTCKDPVA